MEREQNIFFFFVKDFLLYYFWVHLRTGEKSSSYYQLPHPKSSLPPTPCGFSSHHFFFVFFRLDGNYFPQKTKASPYISSHVF